MARNGSSKAKRLRRKNKKIRAKSRLMGGEAANITQTDLSWEGLDEGQQVEVVFMCKQIIKKVSGGPSSVNVRWGETTICIKVLIDADNGVVYSRPGGSQIYPKPRKSQSGVCAYE